MEYFHSPYSSSPCITYCPEVTRYPRSAVSRSNQLNNIYTESEFMLIPTHSVKAQLIVLIYLINRKQITKKLINLWAGSIKLDKNNLVICFLNKQSLIYFPSLTSLRKKKAT